MSPKSSALLLLFATSPNLQVASTCLPSHHNPNRALKPKPVLTFRVKELSPVQDRHAAIDPNQLAVAKIKKHYIRVGTRTVTGTRSRDHDYSQYGPTKPLNPLTKSHMASIVRPSETPGRFVRICRGTVTRLALGLKRSRPWVPEFRV